MLPWIQSEDESQMSRDATNCGWTRQFQQYLSNFVEQNKNSTVVYSMDAEQKRELTKDVIAYCMLDDLNDRHLSMALNVLLILSRDKDNAEFLAKATILEPLQKLAALEVGYLQYTKPESVLMAMKTISNLIYQSPIVQKFYEVSGVAERAMDRIAKSHDLSNNDIRFFELRIIFLLTALSVDVRGRMRHRMHAVKVLNDILVDVLIADEFQKATLIEVLKILFNITVSIRNLDGNSEPKEDDHEALVLMTRTLQRILVTEKTEIDDDVVGHAANLLNNVPTVCFKELISDHQIEYADKIKSQTDAPHVLINPAARQDSNQVNFGAMDKLIELLQNTLTGHELDSTMVTQATSNSVLHLFYMLCRFNPSIRKYVRGIILPPLGEEVKKLPTEGNSLRNILARCMTCPDIELKTLASNVLYILCKENVSRLIKYAGYGNSAGLLADLGFLSARNECDASNNSEDSETEVYRELARDVNPVTGRVENKPQPNDNMTEEQKEYEAMKLVEQMDKMTR
ncbi:hypothetical protein ACOME3_004944 [Neoechinorhynchus agilis]